MSDPVEEMAEVLYETAGGRRLWENFRDRGAVECGIDDRAMARAVLAHFRAMARAALAHTAGEREAAYREGWNAALRAKGGEG
jgi:hypothetical protein